LQCEHRSRNCKSKTSVSDGRRSHRAWHIRHGSRLFL